jgi:SAM-dependent methyltransferase
MTLLSQAMVQRVTQRIAANGYIKLPAVPGLVDEYVRVCSEVFAVSGRGFYGYELDQARTVVASKLKEAFRGSPRSKVEITFEAEPARPLGFTIEEDVTTIPEAYERWIGNTAGPLFGAHPDARVLTIVQGVETPAAWPILDFGAGTGRNAVALARLGHPVDAVEITPKFAEMLTETAAVEGLAVRVVTEDVFLSRANLRRDYQLVFASEVVPDFRDISDLRKMFELAADVLAPGGKLLFNVHLCAQGYDPEKAARELSQQCYSCLFTPSEVVKAATGLPFVLLGNDSVYDFEKTHLPEGVWPPTPWYENWTKCLDVYEIELENSPAELRWLAFEKRADDGAPVTQLSVGAVTTGANRTRRFDSAALRKAVARRLLRRMSASGTIVLPALPGMQKNYVAMSEALFRALGRTVSPEQTLELKDHFERVLTAAFEQSQRSNVVFTYEAPSGADIKYTLTAAPLPLADAYEQWHQTMRESLFGECPDARLSSVLTEGVVPRACPVLDIGAGLGRNALYLARAGHSVDALEVTPRFAEIIALEAKSCALPIRVFARDLFVGMEGLRSDYQLVLASGVVGDFRNATQLRQLFEFAVAVLVPGGILLVNLHLVADGCSCDDTAREWAQQCCAMFYTSRELEQAFEGLPLELVTVDAAYEYEQAHLPVDAWPPTPAFAEWATGRHMYAVDAKQSPIALKWLVFRCRGSSVC